jgi:hypothetical protein
MLFSSSVFKRLLYFQPWKKYESLFFVSAGDFILNFRYYNSALL